MKYYQEVSLDEMCKLNMLLINTADSREVDKNGEEVKYYYNEQFIGSIHKFGNLFFAEANIKFFIVERKENNGKGIV